MSYFRQLRNKNASVIFLQETYSSNNQEKLWSNELGSKKVRFISDTVASTAMVLPFYLILNFRLR